MGKRRFAEIRPAKGRVVTGVKLRITTHDVPEGARVDVTDVQLQPSRYVTGWTPTAQDLGVEPVDGWAWRNGVAYGTEGEEQELVIVADTLSASPLRWEINRADGELQLGEYRFGHVTNSAVLDGHASTATQGAGIPPHLTARSDVDVKLKVKGRATIFCWFRGLASADPSEPPPLDPDPPDITPPVTGWTTRRAWSGESPASECIALQRFDAVAGTGSTRTAIDAASGRDWTVNNWRTSAAITPGRWGDRLVLNDVNPGSEQTGVTLPYTPGMWPLTGKVLLSAWAALHYAMAFSPILSTRNDATRAPLLYLSTDISGRPRSQVYDATGGLVLDQYENLPWTPIPREWVNYMLLLDMDAQTSQLALVRHTSATSFLGPVRPFTGSANPACTADLVAMSLSPTAAYWSGPLLDEVAMSHRRPSFNFTQHVEAVRRSCWARGRRMDTGQGANLAVTDAQVAATGTALLETGAESHAWTEAPVVAPLDPLTGTPLALLSTDNGVTWTSPSATLPASFDGLVRWHVPMQTGETFRGIALLEE